MVQYNLQVGLQWIAAGAHVFVTGPDKKPRVKWRNESTTDPNKLKEWFANWPDSLVAIDLAKSDLVVLDGDRHGGPDGVAGLDGSSRRTGLTLPSLGLGIWPTPPT